MHFNLLHTNESQFFCWKLVQWPLTYNATVSFWQLISFDLEKISFSDDLSNFSVDDDHENNNLIYLDDINKKVETRISQCKSEVKG